MFNYMLHKGADRFWANVALKHIMLNFAGNNHWLTDIKNPKIKVVEFGMVDRFSIDCKINTESETVSGKLIYKHGKAKHHVQVKSA